MIQSCPIMHLHLGMKIYEYIKFSSRFWGSAKVNIIVNRLTMLFLLFIWVLTQSKPEADPGFQVRRAHLKNCAERREARKFLRYFVWKITILRKKIIFFPILGGRGRPWMPLDGRLLVYWVSSFRMLEEGSVWNEITLSQSDCPKSDNIFDFSEI